MTRMYVVTRSGELMSRLIEASNRNQVLRFIAESEYTVSSANSVECCALISLGVVLEKAKPDSKQMEVDL